MLAVEAFDSLVEAKIVIEDRRNTPHHPAAPLEPRGAHTGRYGAEAKERLTARLSHDEWTDKRCPGSLRAALVMEITDAAVPARIGLRPLIRLQGLQEP